MTSTHAALVIAIVMAAAVAAMVGVFGLAGRTGKNAISREHLERDGAYGEEGLRRAEARHNEHE